MALGTMQSLPATIPSICMPGSIQRNIMGGAPEHEHDVPSGGSLSVAIVRKRKKSLFQKASDFTA